MSNLTAEQCPYGQQDCPGGAACVCALPRPLTSNQHGDPRLLTPERLREIAELVAHLFGHIAAIESELKKLRSRDETPEKPDVNDVFRAGVTQAKYRYHYKDALERIANYQPKDAADFCAVPMRDIARAALGSSPEESPEKTAREPDWPKLVREVQADLDAQQDTRESARRRNMNALTCPNCGHVPCADWCNAQSETKDA
jgi:hypothetical protein